MGSGVDLGGKRDTRRSSRAGPAGGRRIVDLAADGFGEAGFKIAAQLGVGVAKGDGADSGGGGGDQGSTERAGGKGVEDGGARAASAEGRRRHAKGVVTGLIKPRGGTEADGVDGVGDAGLRRRDRACCGRGLKALTEGVQAMAAGVLRRGGGEDALEGTGDGGGIDGDGRGERGEGDAGVDGVAGVLLEIIYCGGQGSHERVGGGGEVVGPAAQAGAVAGGLGLGGQGEEADVAAGGSTRRAARFAEDFGGANGVNEGAVSSGVAGEHLLPGFAGKVAGGRNANWSGSRHKRRGGKELGGHKQYGARRVSVATLRKWREVVKGYLAKSSLERVCRQVAGPRVSARLS